MISRPTSFVNSEGFKVGPIITIKAILEDKEKQMCFSPDSDIKKIKKYVLSQFGISGDIEIRKLSSRIPLHDDETLKEGDTILISQIRIPTPSTWNWTGKIIGGAIGGVIGGVIGGAIGGPMGAPLGSWVGNFIGASISGETDEIKTKEVIFNKMIERTITSPPKSEAQLKADIRNIKFTDNQTNKEEVTLVLEQLSSAFLKEGIELDVTSTNSDLMNLHNLSEISIEKLSLCYDKSPIDGSSPDEVLNNSKKSKEFTDTLRETIAKQLHIPIETIVITNLTKGSIKFDIIIGSKLLDKQPKESIELHEKLMHNKNKICKIMESNFGANGLPKEIEIVPLYKPIKLAICPNDFDLRGDFNFPNSGGDIQKRGGMIYHQPTSKWKRLGLRVLGLYSNDDWLMMDGRENEWAVAFHGTSNSTTALSSITATRFFAVGGTHLCRSHKSQAIHTKDQIYGGEKEGAIYFTKSIDHCYKLKSGDYEIAFQCRVNPRYVYDSDPNDPKSFCIVRGSENIRPYGLCFKIKE